MKKKFLLSLAGLLSLVGMVSCTETSSKPNVSVTTNLPALSTLSILNKDELQSDWHLDDNYRTLDVSGGENVNIQQYIYSNQVTITSSDSSVIATSGLTLTPRKVGKSTITIAYNNSELKDSVEIEILSAHKLTSDSSFVVFDERTSQLTYSIGSDTTRPDDLSKLKYTDQAATDVAWTSSDTSIATVSDDGVVSAVKKPDADTSVTITATLKSNPKYTKTITIDVFEKIPVVAISALDDYEIGDTAFVRGVVVAKTTQGYLIDDGTAAVYVFLKADPANINIGDYYEVGGALAAYNGALQFTADAAQTKLSETAPKPREAIALTKEIADGWKTKSASTEKQQYSTTEIAKYSWTAVAAKDGNYWIINLEGSTTKIEASYMPNNFKLEAGKTYNIEAYFGGYAGPNYGDYAAMYITSVEETEPLGVNVQLDQTAVTLTKGQTITLKASVYGAENTSVTWKSDTETVATVTEEGVVTAVANGTATITATSVEDNTKSATCVITVADEVAEPKQKVVNSVSEITNDTAKDLSQVYIIEGTVSKWYKDNSDGTNYGNFYIKDSTGAELLVYGATADASVLSFDNHTAEYSYDNPANFKTNEYTSKITLGSNITLAAVRTEFSGTKQLNAIVLSADDTFVVNYDVDTTGVTEGSSSNVYLYETTGKITRWYDENDDAGQYGNFYIQTEGKEEICIYGATAQADSLKFDPETGNYYLSNPQDFLTNEATKDLKIGDSITIRGFRSDYNGSVQLKGIVVTDSQNEDPDQSVKLSELKSLENGTKFISRGYYMGKNDTSYEGNYNAVYVADGSTSYLLYKVSETLLPDNLVPNETIIEFSGVISNYTKEDSTIYEATASEITIVDSDESIVKPTIHTINAENPEFDLNAGVEHNKVNIEDATVTDVFVGNYGNTTIYFNVGESDTEYSIYLDSRYTNLEDEDLAELEAGDSFTTSTWIAANTGKTPFTYNFAYVENFVRTPKPIVAPTSLTIKANGDATTVEEKKTLQLFVTAEPTNADLDVDWSSSDNGIATVSDTGVVTGVSKGKVTITATSKIDANIKATIDLEVLENTTPVGASIVFDMTAGWDGKKVSNDTFDSNQLDSNATQAYFNSILPDSGITITNAANIKKGKAGLNGIALGTGSNAGTLQFTTTSQIKGVKITALAWGSDEAVAIVNDSEPQNVKSGEYSEAASGDYELVFNFDTPTTEISIKNNGKNQRFAILKLELILA